MTDRLDKLQDALFSKIPGLPAPSQIDHIVVTIAQDLSAVAYVNELKPKAQIKVNRAVAAGEAIVRDIDDIAAVDLGIDVPADSAVVIVRSLGWKRSLFFDVTPLGPENKPRDESLAVVLAKQMILLLGLPIGATNNASLPMVLPFVDPWVSSEDIPKGARWGAELADQLRKY